jgi:hypothetical protein
MAHDRIRHNTTQLAAAPVSNSKPTDISNKLIAPSCYVEDGYRSYLFSYVVGTYQLISNKIEQRKPGGGR